jgi:hypothetical protein
MAEEWLRVDLAAATDLSHSWVEAEVEAVVAVVVVVAAAVAFAKL